VAPWLIALIFVAALCGIGWLVDFRRAGAAVASRRSVAPGRGRTAWPRSNGWPAAPRSTPPATACVPGRHSKANKLSLI
jgi:hypothetical protein